MNWFILVIAGFCEVGFTFCLEEARKATGGDSCYWYIGFLLCTVMSMMLLIKAIKKTPIGTAYAVWTGIGAVGTVLVGIFIFNEPSSFSRMFFLATLIVSLIGLKLVTK